MSLVLKSHLFSFLNLPINKTRSSGAKIAVSAADEVNSSATDDDDDSPSDSPSSTSTATTSRKRIARASSHLARWSRARSLRSGRGIGKRIADEKGKVRSDYAPAVADLAAAVAVGEEVEEGQGSDDEELIRSGKSIYMVSDGTGWTAEHSVSAALGQFEYCLADRGCSVSTHLFSGIEDTDRLMEIIRQAAKEGALLLYTIADPGMADAAKKACNLWGVPHADILGPTIVAIGSHLGVPPLGIPRGAAGRQIPLSEDYFKRIEAIDFTIKQDDGALPQNITRADIILLGVSRTGKTPLSIYLAQKGYKVANIPIVMGMDLPKTVFSVDQGKIYALTINPVILQTIRRTRASTLGFNSQMSSNYSDMDHVKQELAFASKIFSKNPLWPVIEVTGKAIEETAAVIVRIHHDRLQRYTMPRISRRY